MMRTQHHSRSGMSLIEATVVMALFLVFSTITATLLWSIIRIERRDAAAFDRTVRHTALADQFREDVALSNDVLAKAGEYVAGADCLILAQRDGKQVVYSTAMKNVVRTEIAKAATTNRHLPIGEDLKVEFARAGTLITLRFFDVRPQATVKHPVEYSAALEGDLK